MADFVSLWLGSAEASDFVYLLFVSLITKNQFCLSIERVSPAL